MDDEARYLVLRKILKKYDINMLIDPEVPHLKRGMVFYRFKFGSKSYSLEHSTTTYFTYEEIFAMLEPKDKNWVIWNMDLF